MSENAEIRFQGPTSSWDIVLLFAALIIDLADLIPFNIPGAALEWLFLMYLGVPPLRSTLGAVTEVIPLLDVIPWCTLTVLHRRFGVRLGGLSKFFEK